MDRMLELGAAIFVAAFIAITVGCGLPDNMTDCRDGVATVSPSVSQAVEHANSCPLDAVAYDAPKFANGWNDAYAYKVTDRFSGQSWWMIKIDGKWVVLPIESSKEVENAG